MKNVDTEEIVQVVQKFSPYINSLCKKYYIKGGTGDDLFEEGVIGLLQACKSYSGESILEDKFSSFARMCIKRQILDAIKLSNTQKHKLLNESLSLTGIFEDGSEKSLLDYFLDRNVSNDPLDIFIDKEKINEKLKICDSELNEFEKLVLKHYLCGEKQSEIAVELEKDVKVIDNTLQKIKSKLNKQTT